MQERTHDMKKTPITGNREQMKTRIESIKRELKRRCGACNPV